MVLDHSLLLRTELEEYVKNLNLSSREADILYQLIAGNFGNDSIAATLGNSPFTVANQLQELYSKTNTHSKSELLSDFIRFSFNRLGSLKLFSRMPRILVIDDELDIVEMVMDDLKARGFDVKGVSDSLEALAIIADYNPDIIVSDIRMPKQSGYELLIKLREFYRYHPHVLFITGGTEKTLAELYHLGAAGILHKPLDFDQLAFEIINLTVQNPFEKSRLLRVPVSSAVACEKKFKLKMCDIGFGGAFLAIDFTNEKLRQFFLLNKVIEFSFVLDGSSEELKAKGEIVWVRSQTDRFGIAGIGIKFTEISEDSLNTIRDYVRCAKIKSFIPIGTSISSSVSKQKLDLNP